MTEDELIEAYCRETGWSRETFHKYRIVLPCNCDYEGCKGLAVIHKTTEAILDHNRFHCPDEAVRKALKKNAPTLLGVWARVLDNTRAFRVPERNVSQTRH